MLQTGSSSSEWKTGWPTLATAAAGVSVSSFIYYSLGAFMHPLQQTFGWSRGEISVGLLICNFGSMVTLPFYGALADRLGVRRVVLVGVTLSAVAMVLIGCSGPDRFTWYAAWAFLAIVQGAASFVLWTMAVSRRFNKNRGIALALCASGTGVASAVLPSIITQLVRAFGWRSGYFAMGVFGFVVLMPLILLFLHDVRETGLETPEHVTSKAQPGTAGLTLAAAVRTSRFWMLFVAILILAGSVSALNIHLQPMFIDRGMSAAGAAVVVGILGPALIAGRLISGVLLDRAPGRWVAAGFMFGPIASYLLLWQTAVVNPALPYLITALNGLASGAEIGLIAFLTSRYFGMRQYGAIYGIIGGSFTFGAGAAPSLAGWIFDLTGSYRPMLVGAPVLLFVAAVLVACLGDYPTTFGERAGRRAPARGADPAGAAERVAGG